MKMARTTRRRVARSLYKRRGNPETYGPELFYDLAEAVGVPNEWIVIDKHQDGMVWFHVQRGDVRQSDWWAKTTRGGKRMKAKSLRKDNPRKVVRVKESDHVTVNVNPSGGWKLYGLHSTTGYWKILNSGDDSDDDREYLEQLKSHFNETKDFMGRQVPVYTRLVVSKKRPPDPKTNPNVGREPNGPHIVGTTAYQVGVQEGERGTRKSKPTNVQIKDAIEAAYPQYKRTLQPSYVRKLASVYTRQWKAGVKDGKVTKRANKGRRGKKLSSNPRWKFGAYTGAFEDGYVKVYDKTGRLVAAGVYDETAQLDPRWSTLRPHFKPGVRDIHFERPGDIKVNKIRQTAMKVMQGVVAKVENGEKNPRRSNPESSSMTDADRLYREFHGKGPTQTTEVRTVISSRDNLAELGQLCELDVHLMTDEKVKIKFPSSGRNVVMLASSPDGRQLYFEGGNQTVDLRQLGMSGRDWVRDHMALGVLMVVTYRTEKGFDKFELIDYFHKLGEVTGQKPVLTYDTINHLLSVVGGQYEVRPEGIVN